MAIDNEYKLFIQFSSDTGFINYDVVFSSIKITEIMHSELKQIDNTCKLTIVHNQTLENKLRGLDDNGVKAYLTKDNVKIFSGFIRRKFTFTKTTKLDNTSIEIVSPSFALKRKIDNNYRLLNPTVKHVYTQLLIDAGYTSSELVNLPNITTTLPYFCEDRDNKTYYEILTTLFYEYGYILDFNADGLPFCYNMTPSTLETTKVLTTATASANIYDTLSQKINTEKYEKFVINWPSVSTVNNITLFEDTTNGDDTNPCNIDVEAGKYYGESEAGSTSGLYAEYSNAEHDILYGYNTTLNKKFSNDTYLLLQEYTDYNTKALIKIYNAGIDKYQIQKLNITGDAVVKTADNKTKLNNSDGKLAQILDYTTVYIFTQEAADAFINQLARYYKYSDYTYTVNSYDVFNVADIVELNDEHLGNIKCRIIQRDSTEIKGYYTYTLEGVGEYSTTVPTKDTAVASSSNFATSQQVNDKITAVNNSLSSLYNSVTITLYKESESQLTADDLPDTSIYNFGTDVLTFNGSGSNGWSRSYPATPTNQVYITTATAYGKEETVTINKSQWVTPIKSGQNGSNGYSTYTVMLYKSSEAKPTTYPDQLKYNFNTNKLTPAVTGGSFNGWSLTAPGDITENNFLWLIQATALTTGTIATIDSDDWSEPSQLTFNNSITINEVKELIEEAVNQQLETPNIYLDTNAVSFAVDRSGYTTILQQVKVTAHVIQEGEELAFTLNSFDLPEGMAATVEGNEITLTVSAGVRLGSGYISIPITYRAYKYNYAFGWETSENEYFLIYTGEDGSEATEETEADTLGYQAEATSETTNIIKITYFTVEGGNNKGKYNSLEAIKAINLSSWFIGDYFTYTGPTVASELSKTGNFTKSCLYYYTGVSSWTFDEDKNAEHQSTALKDILSVIDNDLAEHNPTADEYLNHLGANEIFAKRIVANEAFINELKVADIYADKFTSLVTNDSLNNTLENYITATELDEKNYLTDETTAKEIITALSKSQSKTIIQGGFIKTDLIDVDVLLADYISVNRLKGGTLEIIGNINGGTIGIGTADSSGNKPFTVDENGVLNAEVGSFKGSIKNVTLEANAAKNPIWYNFSGTYEQAINIGFVKKITEWYWDGEYTLDGKQDYKLMAIYQYLDINKNIVQSDKFIIHMYNTFNNVPSSYINVALTSSCSFTGYVYNKGELFNTLKFFNLPDEDPEEKGRVYTDEDGYIKVSKGK